jgi:capsid protein
MATVQKYARRRQQLLKKFGYDAIEDKSRRQAPRTINAGEDEILPSWKRTKLTATSRDIQRNFTMAAWAVRKHLDYVSSFTFQSKSGYEEYDRRFEELMAWWSRAENCDAAGRHNLPRMVRLLEQCRVTDGDVLLVRLRDGTLQAVESDRIANPTNGKLPKGIKADNLVQGVNVNRAGKPISYAVNRRVRTYGNSLEFERMVSARNAHLLGYFSRFDQVRGVSPLAPAINAYQDLYEGLTYALCKMKVAQMFGLVTYRDAQESLGNLSSDTNSDGNTEYDIKLGSAPFHLDLEDGDKAEILESKTPAQETQNFASTMIGLALKSLDIPQSFAQENYSNYSGSRQALLQYELSAEMKRLDNVEMLNWITVWKRNFFIESGLLTPPSGVDFRGLRFDWVPRGIPWIDPLKEVKANVEAINAGIASRQMVTRSTGHDFFDIADQLRQEEDYLRANDVEEEVEDDPSDGQ